MTTQLTRSSMKCDARSGSSNNLTEQFYIELAKAAYYDRRYPSVVMMVLFIFIGLPGNSVVVMVYFREQKMTATQYLIFVMAVIDLISGVFVIPYNLVYNLHWLDITNIVFCKLVWGLNSFTVTPQMFLITGVSVVRYYHVCRPQQLHWVQTKVKSYAAFCFLVGLIFTTSFCICGGCQSWPEEDPYTPGFFCHISDSCKQLKFFTVIFSLLICTYVVCLTTIVTLNLLILNRVATQREIMEGYRLPIGKQKRSLLSKISAHTMDNFKNRVKKKSGLSVKFKDDTSSRHSSTPYIQGVSNSSNIRSQSKGKNFTNNRRDKSPEEVAKRRNKSPKLYEVFNSRDKSPKQEVSNNWQKIQASDYPSDIKNKSSRQTLFSNVTNTNKTNTLYVPSYRGKSSGQDLLSTSTFFDQRGPSVDRRTNETTSTWQTPSSLYENPEIPRNLSNTFSVGDRGIQDYLKKEKLDFRIEDLTMKKRKRKKHKEKKLKIRDVGTQTALICYDDLYFRPNKDVRVGSKIIYARNSYFKNFKYLFRFQEWNRTTLKLFVVSLVFVVTYIPNLASIMYINTGDSIPQNVNHKAFKYVYYPLQYLSFFGSAMNPLVYTFVDPKFRAQCKALFVLK